MSASHAAMETSSRSLDFDASMVWARLLLGGGFLLWESEIVRETGRKKLFATSTGKISFVFVQEGDKKRGMQR